MGRTSYSTLKARADAVQLAGGVTVREVEDIPQAAGPVDDQERLNALIANEEMKKLAAIAEATRGSRFERGEMCIFRVIDPHEGKLATITSSWEPITESMCTEAGDRGGGCGWDAAKAVGFKDGWDSIPEDMMLSWKGVSARAHVLEKLAQHKAVAHPTAGPKHIRTPDQAIAARANRPLPETFVENPRLT